ncbi:lethal(2) giant larvae protein homolog SRO77 isoform X2 [Lathyrus oleraceus]|uniref:lethal(2) giant larvae protein homolog SRO77 isoform X2 n=1 Tax=Pisum sativum TaxID=3888 RepID=UPI0021D2079E|nr:lethal(2) giant larvae protein homolog SRO77 isoform X2 [Pisum sativum]
MFSRLFHKSSPQQTQQQQNVVQSSFSSAKFDPRVVLHYGVPSNASILAFDRVQRLLAVGTLDGRIKVFGGDNIEGIMISPKQTSFKNLEFLENQGFLASVSSDNEIQVWDLRNRQIASALQWESIITSFSIIYGTSYMLVGTEHGLVYVLKFDLEDRQINILPYYVPTNVISEAVGMSLDHVSVVRVLHQPCSNGKRLLVVYENGVMVLWDALEDQIVLIRDHKNIKLKINQVSSYSDEPKDEHSDDKLELEEDKEISCVSWASNDGSVVAVGYVDGDIMFWDLSTANAPIDQEDKKMSNNVVKLQLSSADRRLPIIILHWCTNKSLSSSGGELFVYGGHEIGSEEVLTVLSIDRSCGIESLKCTGRIDVALRGSFADMVLLSSEFHAEGDCNMLFVLTNPGQLDLYDNNCLSSLMSEQKRKTSSPTMQYTVIIPTLEPQMTTARLDVVCQDMKSFTALSEILVAAKQHSLPNQTSMKMKWPLTGGVPGQLFKEDHLIIQIYIAGYQDGSVRIWDASYPALSLVYNIKPEVNDVKMGSASSPVSALDFCPDTLHLAVGDESGVVRLYGLIRSSGDTALHFVTENGTNVHNVNQGDGPYCKAVFSLQNSAVCGLQFANLGGNLAVGYEHGQVAMLDTITSSILFLTSAASDTSSAVVSLKVKFSDTSSLNIPQESVSDISGNSGKGLVFVMTRDAHFVAVDTETGNMVCNRSIYPKVKSNAISMHIIDGTSELSAEKPQSGSPQKNGSETQANMQSENTQDKVETSTTIENSYFGKKESSLVLLCYESELSLHSLNCMIEGSTKYTLKVNLVQQCCWTTIFKDDKEYVLAVLYQTGDIELRSLPTLEVLGESSLTSILRWNLKTDMEKTICSSSNGQTILVNENEAAFLSLFPCENELWSPEYFPSLHDEVLAAAVDVTKSISPTQNEKQGAPAIFLSIAKNFKAKKTDHNTDQAVHNNYLENLERCFSSPPFLKPSSDEIHIDEPVAFLSHQKIHVDKKDEIHIDEPVAFLSHQKIHVDKKEKAKETDRQKLFEESTTDSKPKARTTEEIKAKYRKTGDAATAAALARDKLVERQEKLQLLNERTEELQNGAEDFASMASELAKRMENRKWWQL